MRSVNNTTGNNNTANGFDALFSNTDGGTNTASGLQALFNNTTGNDNTANGANSLFRNTTGGNNTANGFQALESNTAGSDNTANGACAPQQHNRWRQHRDRSGCRFQSNLPAGNSNVYIGANDAGVCWREQRLLGSEHLFGPASRNGIPVFVDSSEKLGMMSFSKLRFKEAIKSMDKASDAIFSLKPVTFRYKKESMRTARGSLGSWPRRSKR